MSSCDYRIFWEETVKQLKNEIGEQEISMWFSRIVYERASDTTIVLSVPSEFYRDNVRQRYELFIEKKLLELLGSRISIEFEIKPPEKTDIHASPKKNAHTPKESSSSAFRDPQKSVPPEEKKKHPLLNERYTFDKFVIDADNPLPANAAIAVSKNPGTAYNPLLIYGGVGLGKTHLMQAIGNALYQNTNLKILYAPAETFTNEYIAHVNKNKMHEFKNKYRNADVLLLDDIHFLEKKEGTQEELFHTFNALYESNKQIVFTCDRPVEELKNLTDRLRSRFTRGLSIDLKIPSYETRCAILFKKLQDEHFSIPDEVVHLIAKNISSNVRDLESALTKLQAYSELTGPITLENAQRLLQDTFGSPRQHNISIDTILKIVADYFGISYVDLKGKKRTKNISFPRQVAMYLAREMTEFSTTEIGVELGGRDHSTIMHGHQKIETQTALEPSLEVTIAELKKRITNANQ
ncbi:chromosomal replication initiator protein DnaA [Treponema medium]|uniref:Chromosomal replication initiator protein DnaA n=2 Tax=Treponema medium TaxID=58231 RepID=A0AA87TF78_TREMD|nr:chromosomal replication initiator protein DnaA [Treponema medium]EPF29231.1 chromosomal replication initiator protein DnaA [Treponema medium ATCC 700293]QSH92012.1 chromosomal replication initiator protein DnaA [Treponema medium]QSH97144.1 chromosomal replication initiator protein DnaA [Treponema medium]